MPYRAEEAAILFRMGKAPEIWVSRPEGPAADLQKFGIQFVGEEDYNREILVRQGVPESSVHIFPDHCKAYMRGRSSGRQWLLERYAHLTRMAVHCNTGKVSLRCCFGAIILVSLRETDVRRSQQPPRRDAATAVLPAMLEATHLVVRPGI